MSNPVNNQNTPFNPPDGGYGWVIVFAVFLNSVVFGGFVHSSGVLYVALLETFNASKAETALVWTISSSMGIISPAASVALCNRFGHRSVLMVTGICSSIGFVACSFTTSLGQIYFVYGVFISFIYWIAIFPASAMIGKYFCEKMKIAAGIAMSGVGAGQCIFPILTQVLLDNYGWRGTMIIIGGISLHFCLVGALFRPIDYYHGFRKTRVETSDGIFTDAELNTASETADSVTHHALATRKTSMQTCCFTGLKKCQILFKLMCDISLFKNTVYVIMALSTFGHASSQNAVIVHMVNRARDIGIPSFKSASLTTLMGMTQLVCRIVWGVGGHFFKVKPYILYGIGMSMCGIISIISVHLRTYEGQMAFASIFGCGMACYIPMVAVVLHYFFSTRYDFTLSLMM